MSNTNQQSTCSCPLKQLTAGKKLLIYLLFSSLLGFFVFFTCFLFVFCLLVCLFDGNGRIYERWSPIVDLRKKRSRDAPRHFFGRNHLSEPGRIMSINDAAGVLVLSLHGTYRVCSVTDP